MPEQNEFFVKLAKNNKKKWKKVDIGSKVHKSTTLLNKSWRSDGMKDEMKRS